MLTLTQLNNQCVTNRTNSLPFLGLLGPNHNYYRLLTGWGVTVTPLRADALGTIIYIYNWQADA
jgi:hypothetical protein